MIPPDDSAPPKPRKFTPRLPDAARSLKPMEFVDVPDQDTAKCVRAFGRTQRWKMVQRQDSTSVRVWRLK